jgi:predicted ATPase/DNA-binding XRE family transcriptional regulator
MDNVSPVRFGDLLRRYRLAAGLTQDELAERARLSPHSVSDLERGARNRPWRDTVQLLAAALQLTAREQTELEAAARRVSPPAPDRAGRQTEPGSSTALHDLPVQVTSFLGRERELGELPKLLRSSRLLTLMGPPGTGKTRLAIELARQVRLTFRDGVVFVPLAPLDHPDLVLSAIQQRLGLREIGEQAPEDALVAYLKSKEILLVLDNFEQVVAAAPLLVDLLAACPEVRILATSRGALRVRGEQVFPVSPLAVPGTEYAQPLMDPEQFDAVRLFVQRARAAKPDFSVGAKDLQVVGEICRRLDGLPLAIELAAARSAILTPAATLARLERPLAFLIGGPRDLPARQQTLHAAIAWSHALLEPVEQRLFRRLAVFVGGWGISAAAAVCLADAESLGLASPPESSTGSDLARTLDWLESLHHQGLLRLEDRAGRGNDPEPRFGMLETLRDYAAGRLAESGEHEALRWRHAAHFLALAEEAGPKVYGPDSESWLDRLEQDHDNLRAALRWAEERGQANTSLRLGTALYRFWWLRGYAREGWQWLQQALAHGDRRRSDDEPRVRLVRAQALHAAAIVAQSGLWDHAAALPLLEESLAIFRALGERRAVANSLHNLAIVVAGLGDVGRAWSLYEESLGLWRRVGERWGITAVLRGMAQLALMQQDAERARRYAEECLTLAREDQFAFHIAQALSHAGSAALLQGDAGLARARFEESLTRFHELGSQQYVAGQLVLLAQAALQTDEPDRARQYLVDGLAIFRELKLPQGTLVVGALEGFATLAIRQRQFERTFRLAGAAVKHRQKTRRLFFWPQFDRALVEVRPALGDAGADAAWAEGQAMTLEQAIAYALDDDDA